MTQEILIKDIKIGDRFRREVGDIASLVESIKQIGLLHPIVLDREGWLVGGWRRIQAFIFLKRDKIPYNIVDIDKLIGEFHENSVRKDFTVSEVGDIIEYIEKTRVVGRPKNDGKLPGLPKGNTRDIVSQLTGMSPRTIDKIKNIREIVKKEPVKYEKIVKSLDKKGGMSVNSANILISRETRNLPKVPLPKGVWSVVQCDFARKFNNSGVRGGTDNNYDTLTLEQLTKGIFNGQDVRKLFHKDCVMFGWFQASTIFDAKEILTSWGFEAITNQVWNKLINSTGTWLDNYHEHLVIARKGDIPIPSYRAKSVIDLKPTTRIHSHKHPFFYDQIEKLYPKREYLDLFSRYQHNDKWTIWGNQYLAN